MVFFMFVPAMLQQPELRISRQPYFRAARRAIHDSARGNGDNPLRTRGVCTAGALHFFTTRRAWNESTAPVTNGRYRMQRRAGRIDGLTRHEPGAADKRRFLRAIARPDARRRTGAQSQGAVMNLRDEIGQWIAA
jgi:hypothetical protein